MRFAKLLPSVLLLAAACSKAKTPAVPAADSTSAAPPAPARVAVAEGFSTPESVLWDAEQQVWFVSNINGNASIKDGNGFISRLNRDGAVENLHFIDGGKIGVVLNGPKGLAMVGDTLWVADIDAVRGFNKKTGASVASVEFGKQATFLNDVAAGPDGTLYITDTGIRFDAKGAMTHPGTDRVFAVNGRKVSVALEGAWLSGPNGITWDQAAGRFIVVPFGGPTLFGWKPGETRADTIGTGPGGYDGVEVVAGEIYVTSWADSSLFIVGAGGNKKVITGVQSPADIGVDPTRDLVAIPVFMANRVEVWRVK